MLSRVTKIDKFPLERISSPKNGNPKPVHQIPGPSVHLQNHHSSPVFDMLFHLIIKNLFHLIIKTNILFYLKKEEYLAASVLLLSHTITSRANSRDQSSQKINSSLLPYLPTFYPFQVLTSSKKTKMNLFFEMWRIIEIYRNGLTNYINKMLNRKLKMFFTSSPIWRPFFIMIIIKFTHQAFLGTISSLTPVVTVQPGETV